MPGRLAGGIGRALLAILLAGCSMLELSPPPVATSTSVEWSGNDAIFRVGPWPLDDTVAFVCLRNPGTSFSTVSREPPADAGCLPLKTRIQDGDLEARFAPGTIEELRAFTEQQKWYLAVAGRRRPVDVATVLEILRPPGPSDPGPS